METARPSARATSPVPEAVAASKQQILARSPLAGLPGGSREGLLAMAALERLPRKHVILAEGEPSPRLLLLGAGRVKLERTRHGRAVPLGHRGPGQMVGETALAGGAVATESASVIDDVEALALPLAPLRQTLAEDPPLREALTAAIVEQGRALEARLVGLLLYSVEARVAAFLLDASGRWGVPHPEGELLTAPFTHAEIAQLIGSTRETVTLVLGKLKREGLLAFDRRRVVIRDRAKLAQRAATPTA